MIYTLKSELKFGKYNSWSIHDIIVENYGYIEWCMENIQGFDIDEESLEFLDSVKRGELESNDLSWFYDEHF